MMEEGLLLDTKGTCFLCLQDEDFLGFGCSDADKPMMEEVCLKDICRHLKINPSSVINCLRENYVADRDLSSLKEKQNFSVIICPTCLPLCKIISNVIVQMEKITTCLGHKLRNLSDIIKDTEQEKQGSDSELWTNLQQKMGAISDDPFQLILVEHLRQQIMNMCSSNGKVTEANELPKLPITHTERLEINPSGENPPNPTNNEPLLEAPPPNHYQCKHCTIQFASSDKSRISQHLANFHPETLFSDTKQPGIADSAFNSCCKQVMRSLTESGSINTWEEKLFCSFCEQKYSTVYELKYHLVMEHFEILKGQLILAQNKFISDKDNENQVLDNDPGSSDDERPPILMPNSYNLNSSSESISAGNNRSTENKKSDKRPKEKDSQSETCEDTVEDDISPNFIEDGRNMWICDLTNGGCGKTFAALDAFQRHKIIGCAKRNTRISNICQNSGFKDTSKSIVSTPAKLLVKCKYICEASKGGCDKPFTNKANLHRHRLNNCPKRKNKDNLYTCTTENGGCGKQVTSEMGLNYHRKNTCSKRKKRKIFLCNSINGGGCGERFRYEHNLKRHLKSSCQIAKTKELFYCLFENGGCGSSFSRIDYLKRHQSRCKDCSS